ncbi:MAG: outer membrane protein assembly factor BamB family protein [Planctomycetota bacterium]
MRSIPSLMLAVIAASGYASAADWPQFHGPNRDNISLDEGLLKEWPPGGPRLIWKASGLGEGYSSVAVSGGLIYTTGNVGDHCVITALRMDGTKAWTVRNGPAWKKPYPFPGTRSTPTIVDGTLYHLSALGNLACMDARSGERTWTLNILERFGGRNIRWGLSESPLVDGDRVICTPGGEEISMVALDRKTGKIIWACRGAGDRPGYASAILVEHEGMRQIVTLMSGSVVGVRASDGKLLWKYPHPVKFDENITMPVFHDGRVVVSASIRAGATSLELNVAGDECSVRRVWHNRSLDNKHGGLVLVDGRLYGHAESGSRSRPWKCVDFESGETVFSSDVLKCGSGSLTYADGMFYLFTDKGRAGLARATDDGFRVTGSFRLEDPGKRPTWAHPVVCGGRFYIRYGDKLEVRDVAAGAR